MSPEVRTNSGNGFTVIELLVVLAMLGILAMGLLPLTQLAVQRERERELREGLRIIRQAIDDYKRASDSGSIARPVGGSGYPPSLEILVQGVPDARRGQQPIYFLRRVPRDPFAATDLAPERTWGLRSYASPPDRPEPGADVFDVYSKSNALGLNGQPYWQW